MFEMLGLKEDALIQYDELDAMFDQFVENFANGGTSHQQLVTSILISNKLEK